MYRFAALFVSAAILSAGATPAWADVVHLRNGNRLRGLILKEDRSGVVLRVGLKMRLHLALQEIAAVERETPEVNGRVKSEWAVPATRAQPAATEATVEAAPIGDPPPQPTPEQKRRAEVIANIDVIEGSKTPEQLIASLGEPQHQVKGRTQHGQNYRELMYDIGNGTFAVVRFLKTAREYFADRTYETPADSIVLPAEGASPDDART